MDSQVVITLLLLAFTIVMFVTEKLPLAVTAMITCLALTVTNVLTVSEAFAGFVNSNVILFVAMFVVGGALFETGMASDIGGIITKHAKTERQVIIVLMLVAGVLSAFLSNTGATAIFIPIVMGIVAKSGFSKSKLLILLAFATSMGGSLSLIGTPVNLLGQSGLEDALGADAGFGFFEFAKIGLPIFIAGILFYSTIGQRFLPEDKPEEEGTENAFEVKDYSDVPKWKKVTSVTVLGVTVLAMVFKDAIGIPIVISGCIGAVFLVAVGVISEKDAYKSIDLKTIFIFGGSLSLAKALDVTGTGDLIADSVISLIGEDSPRLLVFAIFTLACVMTNFMSNTATTALLVPISISIALGMGADPRAAVMATCIGAASAYATPIGTPPNTMIIGVGNYKFNDYLKAGLPMIIIAATISMILLPIFFPFFP